MTLSARFVRFGNTKPGLAPRRHIQHGARVCVVQPPPQDTFGLVCAGVSAPLGSASRRLVSQIREICFARGDGINLLSFADQSDWQMRQLET